MSVQINELLGSQIDPLDTIGGTGVSDNPSSFSSVCEYMIVRRTFVSRTFVSRTFIPHERAFAFLDDRFTTDDRHDTATDSERSYTE